LLIHAAWGLVVHIFPFHYPKRTLLIPFTTFKIINIHRYGE